MLFPQPAGPVTSQMWRCSFLDSDEETLPLVRIPFDKDDVGSLMVLGDGGMFWWPLEIAGDPGVCPFKEMAESYESMLGSGTGGDLEDGGGILCL